MKNSNKDYLGWERVSDIAQHLGLTRQTIVNWINSGKIPHDAYIKIGRRGKIRINYEKFMKAVTE